MRQFSCSARQRKDGKRSCCRKPATHHYYGYNEYVATFVQFFRCEKHHRKYAAPVNYKVETIDAWAARVLEQKIKYGKHLVSFTFEHKVFEAEANALWGYAWDPKAIIRKPGVKYKEPWAFNKY